MEAWSDTGPMQLDPRLLELVRRQLGTGRGIPPEQMTLPVMGPNGATSLLPGVGWIGMGGGPAPTGLGPLLPGSAAPDPLPIADPNAYETRGWGQANPPPYSAFPSTPIPGRQALPPRGGVAVPPANFAAAAHARPHPLAPVMTHMVRPAPGPRDSAAS